MQHIVERELAKAIEERHAKRGSAIFLDPRTGGVLAMASYPTFDPNDFGSYPPESWRNRAIADVYEPGSTFKIVTAAAALEAGVVRENDRIDCGMGTITLFRDIRVHDHKRYGMLTFAQVIAHSSNVGVIRVAQRIDQPAVLRHYPRLRLRPPDGDRPARRERRHPASGRALGAAGEGLHRLRAGGLGDAAAARGRRRARWPTAAPCCAPTWWPR